MGQDHNNIMRLLFLIRQLQIVPIITRIASTRSSSLFAFIFAAASCWLGLTGCTPSVRQRMHDTTLQKAKVDLSCPSGKIRLSFQKVEDEDSPSSLDVRKITYKIMADGCAKKGSYVCHYTPCHRLEPKRECQDGTVECFNMLIPPHLRSR